MGEEIPNDLRASDECVAWADGIRRENILRDEIARKAMKARKIVGWSILASPSVAIVAGMCWALGPLGSLIVVGGIVWLYGSIALGMYLIDRY